MRYLGVMLMLVLAGASNPVFAELKIHFWSNRDETLEFRGLMFFEMNPDGSNPVNLNKKFGVLGELRWSPDRTKILYLSRPGNADIYVMDADGSDHVQLTNDREHDKEAQWSPDGTKILWERWIINAPNEIRVMDADGSNQRQVAEGYDPKWSPDGTKIGYEYGRIYMINADGAGGGMPITNFLMQPKFLSWSPDGTKVAYSESWAGAPRRWLFEDGEHVVDENGRLAFDEREYFMYVSNIDGSGFVSLVDAAGDGTAERDDVVRDMDWSPDGRKIVCTSSGAIVVVNVDGTNPVRIAGVRRGRGASPRWSPDGSTIVFHYGDIYSINADGSNLVNLTNHPSGNGHATWFNTDPTVMSPRNKLLTTWGRVKRGAQ